MGLFGFGKKKEVVDWTEDYKIQQAEKKARMQQGSMSSMPASNAATNPNPFSFFDSSPSVSQSTGSSDSAYSSDDSPDEKRRKLAKRIMDMTERMEDLSNQIYHLQQRVEVLERKSNINGSGY